jgi:predicted phage terminase large subunit-like protein
VEQAMKACAQQDGRSTTVAYMQDPGSAGVAEAQATARALDGFDVRFAVATGDKETRAKPVSAQAEAGNVKIVRGLWNDEFLRVLENFPVGKHDDEVDGLSGAYERIADGLSKSWDAAAIAAAKQANPHLAQQALRRTFEPRQWQRYPVQSNPIEERFGREKTLAERGIVPPLEPSR